MAIVSDKYGNLVDTAKSIRSTDIGADNSMFGATDQAGNLSIGATGFSRLGDTAYSNAFNQGTLGSDGMYQFTPQQIEGMNTAGNQMIPDAQVPGMTGFQMGQLGLGAANAYMGYKQLGLAEDTFDQNKRMAEANYDANRVQANALIDRANTIGTTTTGKANQMAQAAGGLGNVQYKPRERIAKL